MDIVYAIICIFISIAAGSVVVMILKDTFAQRREFDVASQRLMRQIRKEANRKSVDVDNMILNALSRILQDLKSI